MLDALDLLVAFYDQRAKTEEVAVAFRSAIESARRWRPDDKDLLSNLYSHLAQLLAKARKFKEAKETYQHLIALGPAKERLIQTKVDLAHVLTRIKEFDEAEKLYKEALASTASPPNKDKHIFILSQYANMLSDAGRKGDALKVEIQISELSASH